ncbi:acyltransferase [Enterobacter sichuanensis]
MTKWINLCRAVAICAIVMIHTTSFYFYTFQVGSEPWWVGNILNSASRWAVPLFVMISGFLLLNRGKTENVRLFYSRRLSKILVPIIFWSIFYLIFFKYAIMKGASSFGFEQALDKLISGRPYSHMWFLFMMVGLYIFTPAIDRVFNLLNRLQIFILLMMWFSFSITYTVLLNIYPFKNTMWISWFLLYVPYFIIGRILPDYNFNKYLVSILLLLSFAVVFMGSYYLNVENNTRSEFFFDPLSPGVILLSLSVYALLMHSKIKERYMIMINKISDISMGIFLTHPIFIYIAMEVVKGSTQRHPFYSVLVVYIFSFTSSACFTYILSRLRFAKILI